MIKSILNFFFGRTEVKEKCTCGQEEKWCNSYIYIENNGSFGRENLFKCGKINENRKQYNR